jgi:F-type H+-transporting ATPase subunit delta
LSRIAKRYAKALFELAQEENALNQVSKDFELIRDLLKNSKDFHQFTKNPLISIIERKKILDKIFLEKISETSNNFLKMISQKKRLDYLDEITARYFDFVKADAGVVEGELFAVVELKSSQIKKIKENMERLTGKEVILNEIIDPNILGGFIVKVGDLVIDNSIRNQLERLRKQLAA